MTSPIASGEKYQINTGIFNGPLDLLLSLIEKAELDITKIALAQVTDQYLIYIQDMPEKDATEISYFLVVAAKLIQIKSEALLPVPVVRLPGEEDPGESLAEQLRIYKLFKESSLLLGQWEEERRSTHLHIPPEITVEGSIDLTGITLEDLSEAARTALLNLGEATFGGKVIQIPKFSIREKIGLIVAAIREGGSIRFSSLVGKQSTRLEIIVTFLALLELVKQNAIVSRQDSLFSDITLIGVDSIDEDVEYDLEFGE